MKTMALVAMLVAVAACGGAVEESTPSAPMIESADASADSVSSADAGAEASSEAAADACVPIPKGECRDKCGLVPDGCGGAVDYCECAAGLTCQPLLTFNGSIVHGVCQ